MSDTKVCSKCHQEKQVDEFYMGARYLGGRRSKCKKCMMIEHNEWRKAHREQLNRTDRIRYAANKDHILEIQKTNRVLHRTEYLERCKIYYRRRYIKNPEEMRERARKYYAENKEKVHLYYSQPEIKNRVAALVRFRAFGIYKSQIPQELFEAMETHVALCRVIKQKKEALNV